jgi:N-acetylglucosaminyl-diphospho-decaprenol L-rhamnosyltransferase
MKESLERNKGMADLSYQGSRLLAEPGSHVPDVLLSVIVVSWNTRDQLKACLVSLVAAVAELSGSAEIFVVDNASSDGSAALVESHFPGVRLIANDTNLGFARANNLALAQSSGDYVLLLNSDTELLLGALAHMLAFAAANARLGAAGPLLLNSDRSLQPSAQPMLTPEREFWRLSFLDRLLPRASYRMERWDRHTPRPVETLKGACLLLRRDALAEVGLLDDSYFMYTEEVDLCYRLAQAEWELWWVPQSQVIHHGEASSRQAAQEMYIQLYRSKVQFYRKFGGEKRAKRFKYLVRLAYWPRVAVASFASCFFRPAASRVATYRRLLAELPGM